MTWVGGGWRADVRSRRVMCGSKYRCVPVSTAYAQPPRPNTQRRKLNFRRSRNWPMCESQVRKYLAIAYTAAIEHRMAVSQSMAKAMMQFWWRWVGTRASVGTRVDSPWEMSTCFTAQREVQRLVREAAGGDASPVKQCQHLSIGEDGRPGWVEDGRLGIRYVPESAIWGSTG